MELFPTRIGEYDIMIELLSPRGMKSIYKFKVEVLANETAVYDLVAQSISKGKIGAIQEEEK